MDISKKIVMLRKEAQMTQEELAKACHVSRQAVSRWEKGETKPDIESLVLLAQTFKISIDDFMLSDSLHSKKKIVFTNRKIIIFTLVIFFLGSLVGYLINENLKQTTSKFLLSDAKIEYVDKHKYKITITPLTFNENVSMKLSINPDFKKESDIKVMEAQKDELNYTAFYYFDTDSSYDIYLILSDGKQTMNVPLWNENKQFNDVEYKHLSEFEILDKYS